MWCRDVVISLCSLGSDKAQLCRAVLEGIAFRTEQVLSAMPDLPAVGLVL